MKRYGYIVAAGILFLMSAVAQEAPLQFSVSEVRSHKNGANKVVHSKAYTSRDWAQSVTLAVVVGPDGTVQSARAVDGPKEFFEQAESIERDQTFKPFERDGVPVRAAITDYVMVAPLEEWAKQQVPFPEIKDLNSVRMTLSRSSCFGPCPSYSVEVRGDGGVSYEGRNFVLITGKHSAHVSTKVVQQVLAKFRAANFFSLKERYGYAIDAPVYTTSIEIGEHRHTVVDDVGTYDGIPDAMSELEGAFDDLVGTGKWIRETNDTLPSLLAEHWPFSAQTPENAALFASVVNYGSSDLIGQFLSAGAPALVQVDQHPTAFEAAGQKGNISVIRQILERNESVPPHLMSKALVGATRTGNLELVRLLIGRGADPNFTGSGDVLRGAVSSGVPEVVNEILLHHVNVNASDQNGNTALRAALQRGGRDDATNLKILKTLISAGANVNFADANGQTPIFDACNLPAAVPVLVAAGADVNARDTIGRSALMHCVYRKDYVAAMIAAGASLTVSDHYGETLAETARRLGAKESADLIEAATKKQSAH